MIDKALGARDTQTSDGRGPVHALELSRQDALAVRRLARACLDEYGRAEDPRLLAEAPVIAHELPAPGRRLLNDARLDEGTHFALVRGNVIDHDALGPTPHSWREADTPASRVYGIALLLYGALLGDAIGWATQQEGRLVTDVVPTPGAETSLISASSSRELAWHTEDAHSEHRADWVGLFALRSPQPVPTTVASIDPARMAPEAVKVLFEPRFVFEPDSSHEPAGGDVELEPKPILSGHPDRPVLRVDRDFARARDGDDEAAAALRRLIDHLDRNVYDMVLSAGDVAFVDNRNVVHGRRPFRAAFDGRDRWLKRINVVRDLRRTRPGRPDGKARVLA